MKDVRGNAHIIMFGDRDVETSFQALEPYNIVVRPITCSYIDSDSFTYKNQSQKNTRLHSKKTKCILECLHLINFNGLIAEIDKERIGIYLNSSHETLSKDFPDFSAAAAETGFFQKFKKAIPPTHSIKNVAGIIPGHIAVYYEINGPTFAETSLAGTTVFEKARLDLESGLIDMGVVILANCYDDTITMAMHSNYAGDKNLIEAVGVFIIDKNNLVPPTLNLDQKYFYGYLEEINTKSAEV